MKFGYYGNNLDIDHQISHHMSKDSSSHMTKSREAFKSRRIHSKTITFWLILVEILVILLGTGYYISPLNRITNVAIHGNRTTMSRTIISDMKANPGHSVMGLVNHQSDFKQNAFNRNAQLKSINVNVNHWNHVRINVKEYPIIAYLHLSHRYFAVSNNGKRSYQSTNRNQVDPALYGFKSGPVLKSFIKSYRLIPDSIKPDINKIYYSPTRIDPSRIRVDMNDGNHVYANFYNWSRKMKYYPAIAKSMKRNGIVNLELGAYSKSFNKSNHRH